MVDRTRTRQRKTWYPSQLILLLLLITIYTACGSDLVTSSPSSQVLPTKLDTLLTNAARGDKFSGAILVTHGSQIVLSKGYGGSNTAQTRFQIGSLTKQFTAFAIMILQEQGKLRVQNQLCLYLPGCPPAWKAITIHHLLLHTSGIAVPDPQGRTPTSPEQLVALYQVKPLNFTPGAQFKYSNVGYQLLGYIIQQVSSMPYTDFIQKAILTPLHMRATGFLPQDSAEPGPSWAFTLAPGGLYSTVEDLHRWDQEIATPTLISQKTLKTILTSYFEGCDEGCPARFLKTEHGYSWYITQEAHREVLWSTGEANGYESYNSHYPTSNVDLIILTNQDSVFDTSYGFLLVGAIEDLTFSYLK